LPRRGFPSGAPALEIIHRHACFELRLHLMLDPQGGAILVDGKPLGAAQQELVGLLASLHSGIVLLASKSFKPPARLRKVYA